MQLELYRATGGVTDVKIVVEMTRSEYHRAAAHEYVEFDGVVYKKHGEDDPKYLSIHPLKLKG